MFILSFNQCNRIEFVGMAEMLYNKVKLLLVPSEKVISNDFQFHGDEQNPTVPCRCVGGDDRSYEIDRF